MTRSRRDVIPSSVAQARKARESDQSRKRIERKKQPGGIDISVGALQQQQRSRRIEPQRLNERVMLKLRFVEQHSDDRQMEQVVLGAEDITGRQQRQRRAEDRDGGEALSDSRRRLRGAKLFTIAKEERDPGITTVLRWLRAELIRSRDSLIQPALPFAHEAGVSRRRAEALAGGWLLVDSGGSSRSRTNHNLSKLEKADGLRKNELKRLPDSAIEGRPSATGSA